MITLYNAFAPHAGEFFLVVFAITCLPLLWAVYRYRSADGLTIFLYLAGLELIAWDVTIWLDASVIVIAHLLIFTCLYAAHYFFKVLEGRYGDHLMSLGALMVAFDIMAALGAWHPAIHLSIINILYLAMCVLTFRQGVRCRYTAGKFGECQHVDSETMGHEKDAHHHKPIS